jgi:hypothetical protein
MAATTILALGKENNQENGTEEFESGVVEQTEN